MQPTKWLKLGVDTINLISAVSKVMQQQEQVKVPSPVRRSNGAVATTLHDAGLDDVQFAIYIDLSQDRTNFKIWSPYDEDFVDDIKTQVPTKERFWDSKQRCWRTSLRWIPLVHTLLRHNYPGIPINLTDRAIDMANKIVRQTDDASASKAEESYDEVVDSTTPDPYMVLGVMKGAPDEVIKAAFKAQARRCHSDLGGDDDEMRKINAAYDAIMRERKKK